LGLKKRTTTRGGENIWNTGETRRYEIFHAPYKEALTPSRVKNFFGFSRFLNNVDIFK